MCEFEIQMDCYLSRSGKIYIIMCTHERTGALVSKFFSVDKIFTHITNY